jgi:hypothetical protein
MKKVLVFELNNYHTETFPVYENLLPSLLKSEGLDIRYFVVNEKVDELSKVYPRVKPIAGKCVSFLVRHLQLRIPYFRYAIQKIINREDADLVIFNSIEPKRNFQIFRALKARNKLALVHNPLNESYDNLQKESNEYFFVLSKIVYDKYSTKMPLDGYFLPFFKMYDLKKKVNDGRIVVGVQGLLNYNKRDYSHLLAIATALREKNLNHVVFSIIGTLNKKDGARFLLSVEEAGLKDFFIFHPEMDDRTFAEKLSECDFLITLLTEKYAFYYRDKTSASFSHSAAYNIPLILTRENADAWHLDENVALIYESVDGLAEKFQGANVQNRTIQERYEQFIEKTKEVNRAFLSGKIVL